MFRWVWKCHEVHAMAFTETRSRPTWTPLEACRVMCWTAIFISILRTLSGKIYFVRMVFKAPGHFQSLGFRWGFFFCHVFVFFCIWIAQLMNLIFKFDCILNRQPLWESPDKQISSKQFRFFFFFLTIRKSVKDFTGNHTYPPVLLDRVGENAKLLLQQQHPGRVMTSEQKHTSLSNVDWVKWWSGSAQTNSSHTALVFVISSSSSWVQRSEQHSY